MTGMFDRLTEEEKAAAPVIASKQDDQWELISPVPQGAPKPTFSHATLGRPTKVWPYHNGSGGLGGYIARFDGTNGVDDKTIRPHRYGVHKGVTGWYWKGWGPDRPLYGLPGLSANALAPILVVEGEKTADAAQQLFPGHIAPYAQRLALHPYIRLMCRMAFLKSLTWPTRRRKAGMFRDWRRCWGQQTR